jgi:hypothetical protein
MAMSSVENVGSSVTLTAGRSITAEEIKKAKAGIIGGSDGNIFAVSHDDDHSAQSEPVQGVSWKASQAEALRWYDNENEQFARLSVDLQAKRAISIKNVEELL